MRGYASQVLLGTPLWVPPALGGVPRPQGALAGSKGPPVAWEEEWGELLPRVLPIVVTHGPGALSAGLLQTRPDQLARGNLTDVR